MSKVFENAYMLNAVVGKEGDDKIIVKQDDGLLLYAEIPVDLIDLGETINPDELKSINELPDELQAVIYKKYKDIEV